jgi:hypothetical protein
MSIFLEITQLDNGDIVLREAQDEDEDVTESQPSAAVVLKRKAQEPLVRIRFSNEVKDMLGGDVVRVAEAMIDAATDYLGGLEGEVEAEDASDLFAPSLLAGSKSPTVH